jgi:hypothetical protein
MHQCNVAHVKSQETSSASLECKRTPYAPKHMKCVLTKDRQAEIKLVGRFSMIPPGIKLIRLGHP